MRIHSSGEMKKLEVFGPASFFAILRWNSDRNSFRIFVDFVRTEEDLKFSPKYPCEWTWTAFTQI